MKTTTQRSTRRSGTEPEGKRQRGFTLIELMVVIVLVGITAAIIVPEMKGSYQDALLRSSSRELVDSFNLAYSRAVSLNRSHRVAINQTTGEYAIEMLAGHDGAAARFEPLKGLPGGQGKIDRRITVELRNATDPVAEEQEQAFVGEPMDSEPSRPPQALDFYPDGTADAREVLLRDQQGFGLVLRLNPVTARVRIVELPPP